MTINIEINTLRHCFVSLSTNGSRALLTHSYVSSIEYTECVKAIANNTTWADQVKLSESQRLALFYMFSKVGDMESANQVNANKLTSIPHGTTSDNIHMSQDAELQSNIVNICKPQGLKISTIPYSVNQPTDPQLWDGSFCPISIFSMNKYLEDNAKNITCLLY